MNNFKKSVEVVNMLKIKTDLVKEFDKKNRLENPDVVPEKGSVKEIILREEVRN